MRNYFWSQIRFKKSRLYYCLLLIFSEFHYSADEPTINHHPNVENFSKKCFSIHSVSAYAIPLNPSMLFIFSIAFGRLRFLYQWADMFGYKNAVFLFWHCQCVFSYTILTSNTAYVICKGHLWRSLLLTDGLAAVIVRPNNTGLIDCGIKKWHKNVSLQRCLFQEGRCEMIFKLDLLLI